MAVAPPTAALLRAQSMTASHGSKPGLAASGGAPGSDSPGRGKVKLGQKALFLPPTVRPPPLKPYVPPPPRDRSPPPHLRAGGLASPPRSRSPPAGGRSRGRIGGGSYSRSRSPSRSRSRLRGSVSRSRSRSRSPRARSYSRGGSYSSRSPSRSPSRRRSRSGSYSSRSRSRSYSRSRSPTPSRSPQRPPPYNNRGGFRGRGGYAGGRGPYEAPRGGFVGRGRGQYPYEGGRGQHAYDSGRGGVSLRGRGRFMYQPAAGRHGGGGGRPQREAEPERWPMDEDAAAGPSRGRSRSPSERSYRSRSPSRSPSRSRSYSRFPSPTPSGSPPRPREGQAALRLPPRQADGGASGNNPPQGRPLFPAAQQQQQQEVIAGGVPSSKVPLQVREAAAAALQRQRQGATAGTPQPTTRAEGAERMRNPRSGGVAAEGRERRLRRPREESPDEQQQRQQARGQGRAGEPPARGEQRQQQPQQAKQQRGEQADYPERYRPQDPELADYNPDDYDWDAFFNEEEAQRKKRSKKERKKEKHKKHKKQKRRRSRSPPRSRSRSPPPSQKKRRGSTRHTRSESPSGSDRSVSRSPGRENRAEPAADDPVTRPYRRIYVGGLPDGISQSELTEFVVSALERAKAVAPGARFTGDVVNACFVEKQKRFAFVELRSMEEAANALVLNGVRLAGRPLQVRRPSDFNEEAAAQHGPTRIAAYVNRAAAAELCRAGPPEGAGAGPAVPAGGGPAGLGTRKVEGPEALYISGIPMIMSEVQVREMLRAFGPLKAFVPIPLQNAAVCQFTNQAATDAALGGITTMAVAGSTLRVRKPSQDVTAAAACAAVGLPSANPATGKPAAGAAKPANPKIAAVPAAAKPAVAGVGAPAQQQAPQTGGAPPTPPAAPSQQQQQQAPPLPTAAPPAQPGAGAGGHGAAAAAAPPLAEPTRVVRLSNMLTREELAEPEEYDDIVDDISCEIRRYGEVRRIEVPQPAANPANDPPGVGLVFVEFEELGVAKQAQAKLNGRTFADNVVAASFYDEHKFAARQFS